MDSSMQKAFTVNEAVMKGWELTKMNWLRLLGLWLIVAVGAVVINIIGNLVHVGIWMLLWQLVSIAWGVVSVVALIRFLLAAVDGKMVMMKDLFTQDWMLLAYVLGTYIIFAVVVGIGFILLIVPGIILALMFGYSIFISAEKKMNPIEAMKASMSLTDGHKMDLFILGLAFAGIAIAAILGFGIVAAFITAIFAKAVPVLGALMVFALAVAAGVGYVAFYMTEMFTFAYVYRKLSNMKPEAFKVS